MPPKRRNDEPETTTGRDRKKARVDEARNIAVQPLMAQGEGMKGLPSAIDIEKFVEARAFEISAMESAMKNASASSNSRVWQSLPRHLRRRAASHDVRRVPVRLRERARAEMDPVTRKSSKQKKNKQGRMNRASKTESFLRRQVDKKWLETHIWHAKRMHMANMWGYRLAVKPTEKSFRPSHRASVHGSILHDASYFGFIELRGTQAALKKAMELCCDAQGAGPCSKRYLSGVRVGEMHVYKPGMYPYDLIAPITIMWRPTPVTKDQVMEGTNSTRHTAWIKVHPAAFDDILSSLRTAASLALQERPEENIELTDLRGEINVFEIMGAKASQVIRGALAPVGEDKRVEFKKFWASLGDLQSAGSVPRGMVVGMKVHDPRLKFPPKNAQVHVQSRSTMHAATSVVPDASLAQSDIWESTIRSKLQKPRYKKKDLDERRSKLLVPGTRLAPLRQDDRVPLCLIQRSVEPLSSTSPSTIHGWTLLLPAGWAMPFLPSLTHTGTRVGGQRERATQLFEAGRPCYPRDYPGTAGYDGYAAEREAEERGKWEKKPKAKKVNWEKLGTRSAWRADWEVVLGLEQSEEGLLEAQREDVVGAGRIWLLCGPEVQAVVSACCKAPDPKAGLRAEIDRLRTRRRLGPLPNTVSTEELWKGALVRVRLAMCRRGSPGDIAVIYRVDDKEAMEWRKLAAMDRDAVGTSEVELGRKRCLLEAIIGYVTTGNYSLSRGEGFSIGAIALGALLGLTKQAERLGSTELLVKVRDRDGDVCRSAVLEVLED